MTDVMVIGAGPAGSSAAIRLARAGIKVRLFEKAHFPRPKLCGGFLSPESLADLDELGALKPMTRAGAWPIRRTVVSSPSGQSVEAPLPAAGLSFSREKLDLILLELAREAGVEIIEGTDGWGHEQEAEWTINATGRKPRSLSGEAFYGIQAYFENVRGISDQVELNFVKTGYVGMNRQEEGRVNLCALTSRRIFQESGASPDAVLDTWTAQNPQLRERLAGASRTSRWLSVGPVSLGFRQLAEPRRLYTGDAACVVDPFMGEGIAMGLRSARLMEQAFQTPSVESTYMRLWHREFDPGLRWGSRLRTVMMNPWTQNWCVAGLKHYPPALAWLAEHTRPRIYAH